MTCLRDLDLMGTPTCFASPSDQVLNESTDEEGSRRSGRSEEHTEINGAVPLQHDDDLLRNLRRQALLLLGHALEAAAHLHRDERCDRQFLHFDTVQAHDFYLVGDACRPAGDHLPR